MIEIKFIPEDKQAICDALVPVLQMTDALQDLKDLDYIAEQEVVHAHGGSFFTSEWDKDVNVRGDSGAAMIIDIVRQCM